MKRFVFLAFVFGLCSPTTRCGEFYGDLEALYWKPVIPSVIVGRRIGPNGGDVRARENLLISGGDDGGGRARVGYTTCAYFADLAYLYYCSGNRASFSANPPSTRIRMPAGTGADDLSSLSSQLNFRYQNVDGRLGRCFIDGPSYTFYLYGNARWVDVCFSNRSRGVRFDAPVGSIDTYTQKTHFQGGGVGAGFGGWYELICGLRFNGSLGIGAVIGNLDPTVEILASTGNLSVATDQKPSTYTLPAVDFRLGVDYQWCLYGLFMKFGVGYELDYYFDIIRHNIGGTDRDGADDVPHLNFYSAGFGGPYLKLGVSY
ncbi:MAG: hypothetical protein S4CHLAM2_18430 [Chlamydiales bacterium]|nr:hypothetical protein [Chlamydiales bacterium]